MNPNKKISYLKYFQQRNVHSKIFWYEEECSMGQLSLTGRER